MYQLNPNLSDFWTDPRPYKLLKGGRFSSKTQDAAGFAVFLARNYSVRFLCLRQFQNRISHSVYTVLVAKIDAAGWRDEFDIGVSTIRHKETGSEFLFYGIARNIEEVKGTEGVDICWIEEGEGLTEAQWMVIDPTIRAEGSQLWVLWNPRLQTDFVQAKLPSLLGEDDCIIRHINYDQNPFLSSTARKKAERLRDIDPDAFEHIYKGVALSNDEAAIIKRSFLDSCIDAHIKLGIDPSGKKRIGFDIADDGGDLNSTVLAHGQVCLSVDKWKGQEDELLKSCSRAYRLACEHGAEIDYDSIGVGASAGAHFKALNEVEGADVVYRKFNAGSKVVNPDKEYQPGVLNKDQFENIKAQAWFMVADRIRATHMAVTEGVEIDPEDVISISSECKNLEALLIELSTPHKDYSPTGKSKVESKKDLAKRDVRSPNMADAFIMAYSPIQVTPTSFGIMVKSKYRKR